MVSKIDHRVHYSRKRLRKRHHYFLLLPLKNEFLRPEDARILLPFSCSSKKSSHEESAQWCQLFHAQLHPIAPHHGSNVIDAYFKAERPFKEPQVVLEDKRKRPVVQRGKKEFPDAFIWQTVLDLVQDYKRVHFISNNTKDFDIACKNPPQVTLYCHRSDFFYKAF